MDRDFDFHRSELESLRRSQGDIRRLIREKQDALLKGLPRTLGFETIDDVILSLARFASGELRNRIGPMPGKRPRAAKKSRRPKYSGEVRARVRRDLEAGHSIVLVAKTHGLSTGTVMAWKRAFGLTTKRHGPAANGGHASTPDLVPAGEATAL